MIGTQQGEKVNTKEEKERKKKLYVIIYTVMSMSGLYGEICIYTKLNLKH